MLFFDTSVAVVALISLAGNGAARVVEPRQCPSVLTPSYPAPVLAEGWEAQLIVTDLTSPRGVIFDSTGALLVVQQGAGVARITLTDNGGTCLVLSNKTNVITQTDVSLYTIVHDAPE